MIPCDPGDVKPGVSVRTVGALDLAATHAVLDLITEVTESDGVAPLSEHSVLKVRDGTAPAFRHLLAEVDGRLAGYGQVEQPSPRQDAAVELAVRPSARNRGIGSALVAAAEASAHGQPLHIWSHGTLPAAAALARSMGAAEDRRLLRMSRPLGDGSILPEAVVADGVTVRTFEVGRDEPAWLRVNARAFTRLPDQGGWTNDDLATRESAPWFDPAGFFLAERDGELIGFHWTKVHAGEPAGRQPVGEVYVVGVDPGAQGLGLGKALTLIGLHYLEGRGLQAVMLYVDAANEPAIALYRALGFETRDVDIRFTVRE